MVDMSNNLKPLTSAIKGNITFLVHLSPFMRSPQDLNPRLQPWNCLLLSAAAVCSEAEAPELGMAPPSLAASCKHPPVLVDAYAKLRGIVVPDWPSACSSRSPREQRDKQCTGGGRCHGLQ